MHYTKGSEANLAGADLVWASLIGADLDGADLREATLASANLRHSCLRGADLSRAVLLETIFVDVDLGDARGLDLCKHYGPSTVDHRTLRKSGRLPVDFLRGCGLPESHILSLGSSVDGLGEHYSCFISYSTRDQEFVERLYADLQSRGVRCWFAPEHLLMGDKFRTRIDESIRSHDKVLLVLSEHSISSRWVEDEVEAALEREIRENHAVLVPIRIDEAVLTSSQAWPAHIRQKRHVGDFRGWQDRASYDRAFARLLRDLRADRGLPSAS